MSVNDPRAASTPTPLYTPGIDVSRYQGPNIDWPAVAASGIKFAIIRATQGASYVDPMLAKNHAGAKAAGLQIGLYHVFTPQAGSANASHFIEIAKGYPTQLPNWLDFEPGAITEELEPKAISVLECIAQELGGCAVYASPSTIQAYMTDPAWLLYPLAVAHYTDAPQPNFAPWPSWLFWQHSQSGSVPGIVGNIDLDRWNGSPEEFETWITAQTI